MTTPHVIASSSSHPTQSATSNGIVGSHYRVGKKIGEGSFGVVFEGAWCSTYLPMHSVAIGIVSGLPIDISLKIGSSPSRPEWHLALELSFISGKHKF